MLQFEVPNDREADVLAAVAQALGAPAAPTPQPQPWTQQLAADVVRGMRPAERMLVFRLAEARQRRVAVSELSRDFGLPASPAPDRDFPALTAFCQTHNIALPVVSSGNGSEGWYWLDAAAARLLRAVLSGRL